MDETVQVHQKSPLYGLYRTYTILSPIKGRRCLEYDLNYYGILAVDRDASEARIKEAFKELAIKLHPQSSKNQSDWFVFTLVTEAYDVLSDPLRRAVYDQYGEEGLKKGVPIPDGYFNPYVYHGDPMKTYREFFGTASPYPNLLDVYAHPQPLYDFPEGKGVKKKDEAVTKMLLLSLHEVFYGGMKKMKIRKLVAEADNLMSIEKILTIPIKPGILTGTRIIFPEEGDQCPKKIPADIIFVVEDRKHERFSRDGCDLRMTVDIFLKDALVGSIVTVNTIDDRIIRILLTSVVTPDYTKVITGEGLPLAENPSKRGDLVINFNIEFPIYMPLASKNFVKRAFEPSDKDDNINDAENIHRFLLNEKMQRNVDQNVPLRSNRDNFRLC
ncbi:dnaJ homolog subfamily B member 13-like [Prorops nasuta]|uniref:dnaJ homolog subfamily B member 13-like n=1 Tax=Prorops nasuta TaxID=863751 RepID=UPI0034CFA905